LEEFASPLPELREILRRVSGNKFAGVVKLFETEHVSRCNVAVSAGEQATRLVATVGLLRQLLAMTAIALHRRNLS